MNLVLTNFLQHVRAVFDKQKVFLLSLFYKQDNKILCVLLLVKACN